MFAVRTYDRRGRVVKTYRYETRHRAEDRLARFEAQGAPAKLLVLRGR